MASDEIHLIAGPAGWVQARFGEGRTRRRAFVRFEPDTNGRWNAAEWSIPAYPTDVLRRVPYHRIVAGVRADERLQHELAARLTDEPEPGFRGAFGQPRRREPITLERPRSHRLDDNFYERVSVAYRQALGRGLRPRQAIAKAANVSPDVAGRWIYEARRRRLLPKTRPGSAGV